MVVRTVRSSLPVSRLWQLRSGRLLEAAGQAGASLAGTGAGGGLGLRPRH